MKVVNRALKSLTLAAGILLGCGLGLANAADYPSKPVRVIVPYAAGVSDNVARLIADGLRTRMGVPFLVENRPGANGQVGAQLIAVADPDGYTIMFTGLTTFTPTFRKTMPFDYLKPFTPVALVAVIPYVMVTNDKVPAKDLREFIAYTKANPGKVNWGAVGATATLSGEMLKSVARVDLTKIPYKGTADMQRALVSNEVQLAFVTDFSSTDVQLGLRAIAVTAKQRLPHLKDTPTTGESGVPELVVGTAIGFWAPAKTPRDIILKLNSEINALSPAIHTKIRGSEGMIINPTTPEGYWQFTMDEQKMWAEVAKIANFQPE